MAELYDITLRFDDANHSFTAENGLLVQQVAVLLTSLSKAVNLSEKSGVVLSEIRGNCYALNFVSPNKFAIQNIFTLHKQISDGDFDNLSKNEKEYAESLDKVLGGIINLSVYNKAGEKVKISQIELPHPPEYYYEIGTIEGVIVAIGGKDVDSDASIRISTEIFKINLSPSQETELVKYYKKNKISFLVKKKIKFETDKPTEANLLSYEVLSSKSFYELAEEFRKESPNPFLIDDDTDPLEILVETRLLDE